MYKIGRAKIYFVLLAAVFIHLTILDHARIAGVKPDIVLICVAFFGLFLGPAAGSEAGLFAGLLEDIFSLNYFGINTFVLALAGFFAGSLSTKFSRESKRSRFALVLLLGICAMSLYFVLVSAFSKSLSLTFAEYFAHSILPVSLYTSFVSVPIFLKFIGMYGLSDDQEYL
ncbi:MAG: rod shape-determining protein MreD [Candidatus Omnitrophica bacterium]|nr:rod shape-determining protein MreD [Candidatus Omnitrophota bacterium]MCM8790789.1 rod shape-determining protein MreD [Candidatus Omnitrophota bacterium]